MKGLFEPFYYSSPVSFQNLFVSAYGLYLYRKRYTGIYKKIRQEIERVKSMTASEVKALQEEKLHDIVRFCANQVPYYQKLFAEHGISANTITSISDLGKLPVLKKQTLRENIHLFRPLNAPKPYMVQKTSGSTGTPLSLAVNEYTYKLAMALLVDHEESHGVPFGAPRATFAGRMIQPLSVKRPPFSRYNRAENQRLFSSYHLNDETFPFYQTELDQFQPKELIGYPSAITDLANHYLQANCKPQFLPKAVITNSETLLSWQREKIESVFGCQIFDYYGTAEYVIFAGQDKTGLYQTNPLIGISEIINVEQSSDKGDIVATTLCNKATPLLRYDLGDTAKPLQKSAERLGVKTISEFFGRQDDYILTRDGRKIGRIDHIFKGVEGLKEAQVIQDSPHQCSVYLVLSAEGTFEPNLLKKNFEDRIGTDMKLTLHYKESIARGKNGKFKSVVGLQ